MTIHDLVIGVTFRQFLKLAKSASDNWLDLEWLTQQGVSVLS